MRHHADRPHPRTTAPVRDAEGLVEVEVTDVSPDVARAAEPDHRVHVGAVEIDLAPMLVDDRADVLDALLEHAVRARIGHHEGGEVRRMLLRLRAQVGHIDVPLRIGLHDHHLHPRHHGGGGVGPVRRLRDQTDVTMALPTCPMEGADHEEPGVLPLRTGVRLERDRSEPSHLGERLLQPREHRGVPLGLLTRGEGMEPADLGPGHRIHLGRRVELHRAAAERDHRVREGEIPRLERPHVAQHLRLAAVAMEGRVGEELRGAREALVEAGVEGLREGVEIEPMRTPSVERIEEIAHIAERGGLPHGDAEGATVHDAHVDPRAIERREDRPLLRPHLDDGGIEAHRRRRGVAELLHARREEFGEVLQTARDPHEPLGPMPDGVHPRHHREEHLRGADVGGRLLTADVLLAGLQRHAQRRLPRRIA